MTTSYRLPNSKQKEPAALVSFQFNGEKLTGFEGEPVAAAIMAHGIQVIRTCHITGEPRGVYCGIGHCYECRVEVDGIPNVRACLTPIKAGMEVSSEATYEKGGNLNES